MNKHVNIGNFRYEVQFEAAGLIAQVEAARHDAANQLGEYIKEESTAIAPLRGGDLIASARVAVRDGVAEISYGKTENVVYAAVQHEHTEFFHPNNRQAKYLGSVMTDPATAQAARDICAAELEKRLGR